MHFGQAWVDRDRSPSETPVEELEYASGHEYVTPLMEDPNHPRLIPIGELLVTPPVEGVVPVAEEIRDGEFFYPV